MGVPFLSWWLSTMLLICDSFQLHCNVLSLKTRSMILEGFESCHVHKNWHHCPNNKHLSLPVSAFFQIHMRALKEKLMAIPLCTKFFLWFTFWMKSVCCNSLAYPRSAHVAVSSLGSSVFHCHQSCTLICHHF